LTYALVVTVAQNIIYYYYYYLLLLFNVIFSISQKSPTKKNVI